MEKMDNINEQIGNCSKEIDLRNNQMKMLEVKNK